MKTNNLKCIKSSRIGKRSENQDSYKIDFNREIYIVADGMGGGNHKEGKLASNLVIQIMYPELKNIRKKLLYPKTDEEKDIYCDENLPDIIREIVKFTNNSIAAIGKNVGEANNLGTTLDACLVANQKLYACHVGDGSIFIIDKVEKTLNKITQEHHKQYANHDKLSITEEQIQASNESRLTSYVGKGENIRIDVNSHKLPKDYVVIMGTDGFTTPILPSDLKNVFLNYNLREARKKLVELSEKPSAYTNYLYKKSGYDLENLIGDNCTFVAFRGGK